jgi:hypothetical protein
MKRRKLPSVWVRWRQQRYQTLTAASLAGHLAWPLAAGEAKARHRVARIIGNDAALRAEIIAVSVRGKLRFLLTGDIAGLTEEQAEAIETLSRQPAPAA